MKQRITTYILLAVVLMIWGIIGYRFLSGSGESEAPGAAVPGKKGTVAGRSYPPLLNYRDPFFREVPEALQKIALPEKKLSPPVVEEKELIEITCLGRIEKPGEVYYLISVQSEYYPVRPGDQIGDLKVKYVRGDSIYFEKKRWKYSAEIPEN